MERKMKLTGCIKYKNIFYDNEQVCNNVQRIKSYFGKSAYVNRDQILAVYLDRNEDMLFTICAMFELGIPFLMLNQELPQNRINWMVEKAEVCAVVTTKNYESRFEKINTIYIENIENVVQDEATEDKVDFSEIAYVLFTSGSTGDPKAVQVTRKGLINFIKSVPKIVGIGKETTIGCFTNCSFDIFFLESLAALYSGATVVMGDDEVVNNTKKLIRLLEKSQINAVQFTPSRMKMIQMIDEKFSCLSKIKTIMIGGEQFPEDLLHTLQNNIKATIYNMYGPTETTIWSTIADLTDEKSITIGEPIANTEIYIVKVNNNEEETQEINLCDINEIGEICIAGDGLGKGYLSNPEQTSKAFRNVIIEGEALRIYRTGDLGMYNDNDKLICLGRIDNQIKYNGHRIELEEIESNLLKIEGVANSGVCFDKKYNRLVAFVIPKESLFDKANINIKLLNYLPDYMCPSEYIVVDELIYTTSGKLDRKGLLERYVYEKVHISEMKNEEMDSLLDMLLSVFSNVLGINKNELSKSSSLEEINVNSLQFINIIVELESEFDVEFEDNMLSLLEFDYIGDIYDYLERLIQAN